MTWKTVNDAVGLDGLLTTLLIYGAMARPGASLRYPHITMITGARVVRRAKEELTMQSARLQTRSALRSRSTPDVTATRNAVLGSLTIVIRERLHL